MLKPQYVHVVPAVPGTVAPADGAGSAKRVIAWRVETQISMGSYVSKSYPIFEPDALTPSSGSCLAPVALTPGEVR